MESYTADPELAMLNKYNSSPSIHTAALYEEINETYSGDVDDPIPYNNNMELEEGKYYASSG